MGGIGADLLEADFWLALSSSRPDSGKALDTSVGSHARKEAHD